MKNKNDFWQDVGKALAACATVLVFVAMFAAAGALGYVENPQWDKYCGGNDKATVCDQSKTE